MMNVLTIEKKNSFYYNKFHQNGSIFLFFSFFISSKYSLPFLIRTNNDDEDDDQET